MKWATLMETRLASFKYKLKSDGRQIELYCDAMDGCGEVMVV